MLERIHALLKDDNIDVRLATRHTGICTDTYCVLYEGQPRYGKSVVRRQILIDVIVPAGKSHLLQEKILEAARAMEKIGARLTTQSPTRALEDYRAVSVTMEFTLMCSI